MDMETMGCNYIDGVSGITNHNNYCGAYCMGLGTSVIFLQWCTLIHRIVRWTTYNSYLVLYTIIVGILYH